MKLIHKLYVLVGAVMAFAFVVGAVGVHWHGETLNQRTNEYIKDLLSRDLILIWFGVTYLLLAVTLYVVEIWTAKNKNETSYTDVTLHLKKIRVLFFFCENS